MAFKDRLKDIRIENKLTQGELAKRVGISVRMIQKYESGEAKPRQSTIEKLARVLEVSPKYLSCKTENKYSKEQIKQDFINQEKEIRKKLTENNVILQDQNIVIEIIKKSHLSGCDE